MNRLDIPLDHGIVTKRIKRRVISRPQEFFAATSPGLEHLCLAELKGPVLGIESAETVAGGVAFNGKVHEGYRANLHLRTANRILMRLDRLQAGNFRQLGRKLAEFPWELYLPVSAAVRVSVSTRECRLHHTGALADCFTEKIQKRLETAVAPAAEEPGREAGIFVRGQGDIFTISLDSSGALLHKRGLKQHGGRAPLRETLAAAVLMLAEYDGGQILLDPMCGSGTFSFEAAMIAGNIPAGWFRSFAFMDWPCFRPERWRDIRRKAEGAFLSLARPVIWSSDTDPEAVRKVSEAVAGNELGVCVQVLRRNFFDWTPSLIAELRLSRLEGKREEGLVVLNPPYGKRLGQEDCNQKMIGEILKKITADFRGWRFALLAPGHLLPRCIRLTHVRRPLFHGGLKLTLLSGRVPE
ncbi:MAG: THUMP domain-containing class I SAM-dependent RNA methyltransferase [Thermodesulfobacteriota bacterium]